MTDLIRKILAELPDRGKRSSLDPYRDLVLEMRRRGYSYREMAQLLAERCELKISHAAIHNFVRRQAHGLAAEASQIQPGSAGRANEKYLLCGTRRCSRSNRRAQKSAHSLTATGRGGVLFLS